MLTKAHAETHQVASIIPPILTCLVGRRLGNAQDVQDSFSLRRLAASVLSSVTRKYSKSSHTLKPRLARTCLKDFLDINKPTGTHYGGIIGLRAIGGPELVRALIVPNLKEYDSVLGEALEDQPKGGEMLVESLLDALITLEADAIVAMTNGTANEVSSEETRRELSEKIGDLLASRVMDLGRPKLVKAIMEC